MWHPQRDVILFFFYLLLTEGSRRLELDYRLRRFRVVPTHCIVFVLFTLITLQPCSILYSEVYCCSYNIVHQYIQWFFVEYSRACFYVQAENIQFQPAWFLPDFRCYSLPALSLLSSFGKMRFSIWHFVCSTCVSVDSQGSLLIGSTISRLNIMSKNYSVCLVEVGPLWW